VITIRFRECSSCACYPQSGTQDPCLSCGPARDHWVERGTIIKIHCQDCNAFIREGLAKNESCPACYHRRNDSRPCGVGK
jgi:hypothetical protein